VLESITAAPPDAILGLTEAFKSDKNPKKVNLGVGIYKDETGVTPVLESVKKAEEKLLTAEDTKSYLPIPGMPEYGREVRALVFGEGHELVESGRAVTAHTPGGTGGLKVGADFLKQFLPDSKVWLSRPTWANHKGIFQNAGFEIAEYPYYDATKKGIEFYTMHEALNDIPANDIVLLHACCHNPTGIDLGPEEWTEVANVAKARGWIPFVDFAYQGFSEGLNEDRQGLLTVANAVEEMLVASSFSKNFGLYRERTGALTLVGKNADQAAAGFSHMKKRIRTNYSNPPAHGGLIVLTVLQDKKLRSIWEKEVDKMRERITSARGSLVEGLKKRNVPVDFSFMENQRGMFSFSGLSESQVEFLRDKKSIYIVKSGRINVAGITPDNIDYLCDSIAEALQ
jgi:aspartate/tyrosine/aromatic aminotransferase